MMALKKNKIGKLKFDKVKNKNDKLYMFEMITVEQGWGKKCSQCNNENFLVSCATFEHLIFLSTSSNLICYKLFTAIG